MIPPLTVRTKVTLAYTLVFGLIFSGFAWLVYRNSLDASLARLDAAIETFAGKIEAEVQEQTGEGLFPAPAEFKSLTHGDLENPRYLLRSLDGTIALDDSLLSLMAGTTETAEGGGPTLRTLQRAGHAYRVYSGPVEVNDSTAFLVTVAAPMTAVESGLERLLILFLFAVPAVLVLAAVAAYFISRAAFSPVLSMIESAGRISATNLGDRLALPRARDEVRLLGETLNSMMDRIEKAFDAQRRFIADASHEIRTPLTIIRSDLEFLQKKSKSRVKSKEIGAIVAEVDRLSKMAENLLLLSRLDASAGPLKHEVLRVDELIVECVQDMSPLFRAKGVSLGVHIGEAVEIRGDGDGVKRILLNLLDNSLKFTKRGGRVAVSLGREINDALPVHVTVTDTGCGIAPGDLPHIFGRFFRPGDARGDGGGSGLGLAIVDHLVKLHGGLISVESRPNEGTAVSVRFPL